MSRGKHIPVSLQFLFVAAFLVQMITGVVGITVPIYADSLGASPFLLGVIGAAGGLIYSFMPLVSGILSDKFTRKAFISASMASYTSACLLYILSEEPSSLIFIKIIEWLSIAAFWPTLEALIADSSEERLEEALKKFNIAWGSAMVIGPTIGGAMISGYSVKAPFFLSFVITFLLGLLSLVFVKGPSREPRKTAKTSQVMKNSPSQDSILNALSSIFLFSSLIGIVTSLFPAYATSLGIPAYEVGLMMFAFGAARTVTFYKAYRIEAKVQKMGMFLGGSLVLALGSFLVANSYTTPVFTACFLIFGFGTGISYAASISHILRRWGSSRGYAAGLFESLVGTGYFVGPLIGGIVSEYSSNAPYLLGSLLSIVIFAFQLALSMRRDFKFRISDKS